MKKIFGLLTFFVLLNACISKQTESLPISQSEVEKLLLDVHVAESGDGANAKWAKKDSLAELYYDQIAEIHDIDRETLDTCLVILQRNPEMAGEIYGRIAEELDKRQLGKKDSISPAD